jgi:thiamine pyrophosphate-dependent acetolactate synthase large subunit-like protein
LDQRQVRQDEGLDRRAVVARLMAQCSDVLVVAGLGSPGYDLFAAGDRDLNFYLWGAMGGAAAMGLGLALAQPGRPVLVLTGDGEQLMGLGALATIGARKPNNLVIVVLDNQHYGETGMQPSHTRLGVSLTGIAAASGFGWTVDIAQESGLAPLAARIVAMQGCGLANVRVRAEEVPRALPARDGVHLKTRFRAALGFRTI